MSRISCDIMMSCVMSCYGLTGGDSRCSHCYRDVYIPPFVRPEAVQQRGTECWRCRPFVRHGRWLADVREACRAPDDASATAGALFGQTATTAE